MHVIAPVVEPVVAPAVDQAVASSLLWRPRGALRGLAASALALTASAAFAQSSAPEHSIGAALRWQPVIDGVSQSQFDLVPLVDWSGGPGFARTTRGVLEAGVRTPVLGNASVGAQVAFEAGRDPAKVDALAGLGLPKLSPGLSYGPFIEVGGQIGPVPIGGLLRFRAHADRDRGGQIDLRTTFGVAKFDGGIVAGFGQLTWADELSMQSDFGITPTLAATSGLRAYEPGGGLRQASAGLLGTIDLASPWQIAWTIEGRRLGSGPTRSPLVSRRHALALVLGVTYGF